MQQSVPSGDHRETLRYYRAVAERMVAFLVDRPVAVRSRSPGSFARRVGGSSIRVKNAGDLIERVEQGAMAFYVSPVADSGEIWFALRMEPRGVPFEVVRLTALKLHLVLEDTGLDGLTVFDGDSGIWLLWTYGVVDPDELPGDIWSFQRSVAAALQVRIEERLDGTPERDRIGRWMGWEGRVTRIEGTGTGDGVIVSAKAMSLDGLVRVPFSLNEDTLLAAVPVSRGDLYRFGRERYASRDRARRLRRRFEIPLNFPRSVARVLQL